MRFLSASTALCLGLLPAAAGLAAVQSVRRADAPGAGVPAAAASSSGTPTASSPAGDAAAKHAKRTACLKDAKAKKLVGARKTSFLKDCMAAS